MDSRFSRIAALMRPVQEVDRKPEEVEVEATMGPVSELSRTPKGIGERFVEELTSPDAMDIYERMAGSALVGGLASGGMPAVPRPASRELPPAAPGLEAKAAQLQREWLQRKTAEYGQGARTKVSVPNPREPATRVSAEPGPQSWAKEVKTEVSDPGPIGEGVQTSAQRPVRLPDETQTASFADLRRLLGL